MDVSLLVEFPISVTTEQGPALLSMFPGIRTMTPLDQHRVLVEMRDGTTADVLTEALDGLDVRTGTIHVYRDNSRGSVAA